MLMHTAAEALGAGGSYTSSQPVTKCDFKARLPDLRLLRPREGSHLAALSADTRFNTPLFIEMGFK